MTRVDLADRILGSTATAPTSKQSSAATGSFGQVLLNQTAAQAGVKFSAHAQARLASRQITLSSEDITKLGDAMTRAAQKGARESLVLMDKAALVVSVPNRTVITAVDKAALKENIFTNIDSAMIL
jgi:flagellar operon protein